MQYLHSDLGTVAAGSVAIVELTGTEANVLLLDDANFGHYQRGANYHYYGGHYTSSPARITVPLQCRWHVVIDLGGAGGSVSAAVRVQAA
jgi:hypothetical protein